MEKREKGKNIKEKQQKTSTNTESINTKKSESSREWEKRTEQIYFIISMTQANDPNKYRRPSIKGSITKTLIVQLMELWKDFNYTCKDTKSVG